MANKALEPELLLQHISGLDSLEPCICAGGFGWVYPATIKGNKEALKVIKIDRIDDPTIDPDLIDAFIKEQISRVRREVEALNKCKVAELVKLGAIDLCELDVGEDKYLAFSEEFLEGCDLRKLILQKHSPDLKEVNSLFRSLLRCIEDLWSHGYIHRDIKPGNVIKTMDQSRPFVLLDLGIAYAVYETSITYKAAERMPIATYRYLAPEMLQPDFRDRIDYRSDLYTTGLTVFEFAAGQHPLARDSDDMIQTISRALRQTPRSLKQYRPDLPEGLCNLVDGMLKKKPALRPANIKMLFKKLEVM